MPLHSLTEIMAKSRCQRCLRHFTGISALSQTQIIQGSCHLWQLMRNQVITKLLRLPGMHPVRYCIGVRESGLASQLAEPCLPGVTHLMMPFPAALGNPEPCTLHARTSCLAFQHDSSYPSNHMYTATNFQCHRTCRPCTPSLCSSGPSGLKDEASSSYLKTKRSG